MDNNSIKIKRRSSLSGEFIDLSTAYNEEKIIEDAITTPYEKVLKILIQTKNFLAELHSKLNIENLSIKFTSQEISKKVEWVINRIQSNTLYTYEFDENIDEKISEENPEIKSFLEFLSDYSEAKEQKNRNRKAKSSKSTKMFHSPARVSARNEFSTQNFQINDGSKTTKNKPYFNFTEDIAITTKNELVKEIGNSNQTGNENNSNHISNQFNNFHIKNNEKENSMNTTSASDYMNKTKISKDLSIFNGIVNLKKAENKKKTVKFDENETKFEYPSEKKNSISTVGLSISSFSSFLNMGEYSNFIKSEIPSNIAEKFNVDENEIVNRHFDIHEFESKVGRANVLPIVGNTIYKKLDLIDLINCDKLDAFFEKISSGYLESVQYHNSVHAADVAQTICTFFLNSNFEEIILLTGNDRLSIISAALAHDIGHPGRTNSFHINSFSDIAITYNDHSVLENFHTSTFFKICCTDQFNIFDTLSDFNFKQFRKRIISLILSTDMTAHAKVNSVIKPKIIEYKQNLSNLNDGNTFLPFISDSNLVFDEQQKVLDFVLHTADISNSSKSFSISFKWTELLMDEFWQQGDLEKELGIPVSFLCDRSTTNIPKSQIGFIRGIVLPTFEILIDLLPTLNYLKEEIEKNLEEWAKLNEETRSSTTLGKSTSLIFHSQK